MVWKLFNKSGKHKKEEYRDLTEPEKVILNILIHLLEHLESIRTILISTPDSVYGDNLKKEITNYGTYLNNSIQTFTNIRNQLNFSREFYDIIENKLLLKYPCTSTMLDQKIAILKNLILNLKNYKILKKAS